MGIHPAILRRRGGGSRYGVLGLEPPFVAGFGKEYYRANSTRSTFADTLTFSRASSATMVDSTGTLVTVGVDEPRIGHHIWDGSAWVDAGYLHESEARTNLVTYSEDFTQWDAYNESGRLNGTANAASGPDGSDSLTKLFIKDSNLSGKIVSQISLSTAGTVCISAYFSADELENAILILYGSVNNWVAAVFDVSSGTITQESEGSASGTIVEAGVIDEGDGLYRCYLSGFADDAIIRGSIGIASGPTPALNQFAADPFAGTVGEGLNAGFAQIEAGSTPSSLIPTNGAAATRAAETLTAPSANLPWPTPQVIGDELVTNGTFDADLTGWTINDATRGTAVVSGGRAVLTNDYALGSTSGFTGIIFPITTVVGKVYQYQGNLAGIAGIGATNNSSGSSSFAATTGTGDKTIFFVATATTTYLVLYVATSDDAATANFDNISVREINPLAVSIQMEGTMTYADGGLADEVVFVNWEADASNLITQQLSTFGTRTGAAFFTQEASGVLDTALSAGDAYSPGINVPFNIASTHASTFIAAAVDGTSLTENTTPVALPDLENTDVEIGYAFMGTIKTLRIWADDIGDTGIAEAST